MKIVGNIGNVNNQRLEQVENKPVQKKDIKSSQKLDTIEFSSNDKISDEQFIKQLGTHITKEVMHETDHQKLDELKQQVLLGEYDVNPAEIARKILGDF